MSATVRAPIVVVNELVRVIRVPTSIAFDVGPDFAQGTLARRLKAFERLSASPTLIHDRPPVVARSSVSQRGTFYQARHAIPATQKGPQPMKVRLFVRRSRSRPGHRATFPNGTGLSLGRKCKSGRVSFLLPALGDADFLIRLERHLARVLTARKPGPRRKRPGKRAWCPRNSPGSAIGLAVSRASQAEGIPQNHHKNEARPRFRHGMGSGCIRPSATSNASSL